MTADDFRRIALGMRGAVEQAHMGHPDFRVNGRIFATLRADGRRGMVKLTPDQQDRFVHDFPRAFAPESGAWGLGGCTAVALDAVDDDTLGEALTIAWQGAMATARASRPKQATRSAAGRRPADIDDYLASLTDDTRAALEKLRRAIKAAAPRAEECISYGIPAFRLDGRVLVFFAAAAKHCSFFPGAYPIAALKDELTAYGISKGTVRFDPARPLPAALVRRLVKARIEEHERITTARKPARRRRTP
jgi:uncharacterized protein YdhG (YjbR/CyaY superfamily)